MKKDEKNPKHEANVPLDNAIDDVCRWLIDGKGCVLFLGAAFSARDSDGTGVPSTADLLRVLGRDPGEDLSEALENKYGPGTRGGLTYFFETQLGSKSNTQPIPKRGHYLAAQLPFRTVITTNCDGLMEQAYESMWKDVARVVLDEDLQKVATRDVTIVKPHGCVVEAREDDFFVFTKSQYKGFSSGRPLLVKWLTAILATHHVLYLGYGIKDKNFLKVIEAGLGGDPLRRRNERLPPGSYAVLGEQDRPDFVLFANLTGINLIQASAEEFMARLVAEYLWRLRARSRDCEGLLREAMNDSPRFVQNCRLASLVGSIPIDLLQWELKSVKEEEKAQDYFWRFYQEGLLVPEMAADGQWYRLHKDVIRMCLRSISKVDRVLLLKEYKRFLSEYQQKNARGNST